MWDAIFDLLMKHNIKVYFPGQKLGECLQPYVVVKDSGTVKHNDFSTTITYYDIMCYVPQNRFSTLASFVELIKGYLKELSPRLRTTYEETPSFYDDSVKAHMISLQYLNYRKI